MHWETLANDGDLEAPLEERLALFVAGDDPDAKAVAAKLIEQIGFASVDTGTLSEGGRRQQPGTAIYNKPMRKPEAQASLSW